MSTKGIKRRLRRTNTNDDESDKKNDEMVDLSDDNKSTISTDTEKDASLKDIKEDLKENSDKSPKTKSNLETKIEENGKDKEENDVIIEEKTNGQPENNSNTNSENQNTEEICDLEPLVLVDTEEQELLFPSETGSEASEVEKSPVLNRCKTRRSQSRNLPTPKTPKTLDFNGETEEQTDLKSSDARLQPTVEEENEEKSENVSVISIESTNSEKTQDTDITNSSTIANVGDTTKNLDITTTTLDETSNAPSFIDLTKNKSYGETLRYLSGRKTLRNINYKPRFYNSTIELHSNDIIDGQRKYSTLRSASQKRKLDHDSPGESKKAKTSSSPGFFSYLTSPFRSMMNRNDIPSSTPKLTGFKYVHHGSNQIDEVEKVGVDAVDKNLDKLGDKIEEKDVQPKKWCTVM